MVKVVGLGGSLSNDSRTLTALETALEGAQQSGAETTLLDLKELNLPFYDERVKEPRTKCARF